MKTGEACNAQGHLQPRFYSEVWALSTQLEREIATKLNIYIQQHDFCIRSSFFYYKKCFHFHAICQ